MKSDVESANFSKRSGESPPNEQENKKIYNIEINQINSIMEKYLNTELKIARDGVENLKQTKNNLENGIDAAEAYSNSEISELVAFKKLVIAAKDRHRSFVTAREQAQLFMKNIPSLEQMKMHLPDVATERLSELHEDWKECRKTDHLAKINALEVIISDMENEQKEERKRAKETKIAPSA
jgi:hypothetical protein